MVDLGKGSSDELVNCATCTHIMQHQVNNNVHYFVILFLQFTVFTVPFVTALF